MYGAASPAPSGARSADSVAAGLDDRDPSRPMSARDTPLLTHEQLLTLARKVQAAAHDRDQHRLDAAYLRLLDALHTHLDAEHDALRCLSQDKQRVLARGQRRLMALLAKVSPQAQRQSPCSCAQIADELLARLALQASDERHLLGLGETPSDADDDHRPHVRGSLVPSHGVVHREATGLRRPALPRSTNPRHEVPLVRARHPRSFRRESMG
jgi:hypothetical protein